MVVDPVQSATHRVEGDVCGSDVAPGSDPRGHLVATAFGTQDSSMIATLSKANCLLIREPYASAAEPGGTCSVIRIPL